MPLASLTSPTTSKPDQPTARANRKRIFERVRNDFTFLPQEISAASTTSSVNQDSTCSLTQPRNDTQPTPERVVEWREYAFASSDPSSEDDEVEEQKMANAAIALEADSARRIAPRERSGSGLGQKIRQKRRSLLSHILPGDRNDDEGPKSPASSTKSPRSSQSSRNSGEVIDDGEEADDERDRSAAEAWEVERIRVKSQRKARRRARLENEKQWNDGLDFWARRRDAWCCARPTEEKQSTSTPFPAHEPTLSDQGHSDTDHPETDPPASQELQPTSKPPSTDDNVLPQPSDRDDDVSEAESPRTSETPDSRPTSLPPTHSPTSTALTSPDLSESHLPSSTTSIPPPVELPFMAPILPPDDLSRSQINNPRAYGAIYSKIVVQGLTPSVPINLQTMTSALVQGWKQDGEWPPGGGSVGLDPKSLSKVPLRERNGESMVERSVRKLKEKRVRRAT